MTVNMGDCPDFSRTDMEPAGKPGYVSDKIPTKALGDLPPMSSPGRLPTLCGPFPASLRLLPTQAGKIGHIASPAPHGHLPPNTFPKVVCYSFTPHCWEVTGALFTHTLASHTQAPEATHCPTAGAP